MCCLQARLFDACESADCRKAKNAGGRRWDTKHLEIHALPECLVPVQKKADEVLSISKQLARSWQTLGAGIRNQPGANPVGLNKPKAIVVACRVAALSIHEAFVLLRRHRPDEHAVIVAGAVPAVEELIKAAPKITSVWANVGAARVRKEAPKTPNSPASAGVDDAMEATVWWATLQAKQMGTSLFAFGLWAVARHAITAFCSGPLPPRSIQASVVPPTPPT